MEQEKQNNTAYDMWRECDQAVAVLQGKAGALKEELAAEKRESARLAEELAAEKQRSAHLAEVCRGMEAERDTWKRMYESIIASRSYKAIQKVKKIVRRK